MAYLLGYGTAVEWLRHNTNTALLSERFALPPLSIEASHTKLQRHAQAITDLTRPLHLVVSMRDSRRPSSITKCHLFAPSSFTFNAVRVDRGIFCCGPELAFVQMGNLLDEERLLMLGMELCGRYGISPAGTLFEREQTCTPEVLRQTAMELGRVRGKRKALLVAPRVLAGAASPMEAALALMLHEPPDRGGFGLRAPELNHPIPVEGTARKYWDFDTITPDLLWNDERVAIEYDSDAHHLASARIAQDALRRDVLAELGYRVITVTSKHMNAPRQIERVASIVASSIGQALEPISDEQWTARVAYQTRLRRYATNPTELLGFS